MSILLFCTFEYKNGEHDDLHKIYQNTLLYNLISY